LVPGFKRRLHSSIANIHSHLLIIFKLWLWAGMADQIQGLLLELGRITPDGYRREPWWGEKGFSNSLFV
jgi:hypothetical protein